jgi:hypothetical protein
MSDGPFMNAVNCTDGVVRKELVTFKIKNNQIVKEVAVREYYKNGDYHDSISHIPLVER